MGKFKSSIKHYNSDFNIFKGASINTVQFPKHAVDTPKSLIFPQLRKIAPNSRNSVVGSLKLHTDTVFSQFLIWISLSPLSYCNGSQRTQTKQTRKQLPA
jgi:hypothetical protein